MRGYSTQRGGLRPQSPRGEAPGSYRASAPSTHSYFPWWHSTTNGPPCHCSPPARQPSPQMWPQLVPTIHVPASCLLLTQGLTLWWVCLSRQALEAPTLCPSSPCPQGRRVQSYLAPIAREKHLALPTGQRWACSPSWEPTQLSTTKHNQASPRATGQGDHPHQRSPPDTGSRPQAGGLTHHLSLQSNRLACARVTI